MAEYDIIVIGIGSMGSAACYHLAQRGVNVLGIEQFGLGHERGSHTGETRLIRKAYFEHPDYVPLLERAYENWLSIEKETNTKLYFETGIAYFGYRGSEIMEGTKRSARLYNLPLKHEQAQDFADRLGFRVPANFESFTEPQAGFLLPELAIKTYASRALELGAEIKTDVTVVRWHYDKSVFVVETNQGTFISKKLIVTAGSWTSKLLPQLKINLKVTRQLLAWAELETPQHFELGKFPCWFIDDREHGLFYGFPILPHLPSQSATALKVAHHFPGTPTDPDKVENNISKKDESIIRYFFEHYMSAKVMNMQYKHCLYTYSPDSDFIIDHLPGYDNKLTIGCGFSGHGFKFASVIGEILADLAIDGATSHPIEFLRLSRFGR